MKIGNRKIMPWLHDYSLKLAGQLGEAFGYWGSLILIIFLLDWLLLDGRIFRFVDAITHTIRTIQ